MHRVEGGVVEGQRLVEVAHAEVGARQVRVAPGLLDLGPVEVDAVRRGTGELRDVLGDGPAATAKVQHLVASAELEVARHDALEQDLVLEDRLVRVDDRRHVHLLDRTERAEQVDDLVELLELVAAALPVALQGHAVLVVGLRALRRVREQLVVGAHVGVEVVLADLEQADERAEAVTQRRRLVLHVLCPSVRARRRIVPCWSDIAQMLSLGRLAVATRGTGRLDGACHDTCCGEA